MIKRTGTPTFATLLCAILLLFPRTWLSSWHAKEGGGTIKGKIDMPPVVAGVNRQRPLRYGGYSSAETGAPTAKEQAHEVTNVVVYLEGPGLDNIQRDTRAAVLDQRDATFIPHVLPIVKGTTVKIVNRDKTYHNVFSLSSVKKFNIGRRPTGEEVPVTFDKLGAVQVFCDIHSHMSAFIVVLPNALFIQPKADGTFSLEDVPPGKYTVQLWHERLSTAPQSVTVTAGETATVSFTMQ